MSVDYEESIVLGVGRILVRETITSERSAVYGSARGVRRERRVQLSRVHDAHNAELIIRTLRLTSNCTRSSNSCKRTTITLYGNVAAKRSFSVSVELKMR